MSSETASEFVFSRVKRKFFVGLVVSTSLLCAAVALAFVEKNRQLRAVEIIGACLCAFYGAYCIWEIRDPSPGLVIDGDGIVDNLGSNPYGRIPWSDITGFRIFELMGTRYVVVDVVDHQRYLQNRGWSQSAAKLAMELAGSPIDITGDSIGLTADELLGVLSDARAKFAANPGQDKLERPS